MNFTTLIQRALDAEPDELRFRLRQNFSEMRNRQASKSGQSAFSAERHLHSLGINEAYLSVWFNERASKWFLSAELREQLRDYYEEHELERSLILRRAQLLVDGKMPIFSRAPVEFIRDDRWRRDFFLNTSAPQVFYGDIGYLDVNEVGDSKHVWEPNRFGWVYWLGQAYVITQDKKYAETFAELTLDWRRKNPYPIGVNYCSALEVAFRGYALLWSLDLFAETLAVDHVALNGVLEIIWRGCWHIESNLSTYFAPNTHLTGEAFSLYACGAALPEFAEAERWREMGERILVEESAKQFHDDGTHRELSSCYHLYSTDFYVQAALISRRTGFAIDPTIDATARKLAERLGSLVTADLTVPQFNDCDGGRLDWFAFEPLDAAPTLVAASELFGPELLPATLRSPGGYGLWMNLNGIPQLDNSISATQSEEEAFGAQDSGIVTYRSPGQDYLLARCGGFGYMDCGHSHDAPTSFIYESAGQPVIVDCGTGSYTQSIQTRNEFRAATGKNILLLNGRGPSAPDGWFSWKCKTKARLQSASKFEGGFYLKTRHDGHSASLGFEVEIAREIVVLDEGLLIIVDNWEAEETVKASLQLTLSPRLQVTHVGRLLFEEDGSEFHYLVSPRLAVDDGADDYEADDDSAEPKTVSDTSNESPTDASDDIPEQEWAQDIRFRPRALKVPYSPDYGIIGGTNALVSDFGSARAGFATTILSRLGPARNTNDSERYRIGLDEAERELFVGRSGKIYLSGKKTGAKRTEPVVFAR
jgi:Heparinase II/III N-terminus/Heparinase II/III-like protein